jgi:hypothetical protein
MRALLKTFAGAAAICCLASFADAGDPGDPAQSCDGSTFEMVECLKARTAQWDKRMNVAGRCYPARKAVPAVLTASPVR